MNSYGTYIVLLLLRCDGVLSFHQERSDRDDELKFGERL